MVRSNKARPRSQMREISTPYPMGTERVYQAMLIQLLKRLHLQVRKDLLELYPRALREATAFKPGPTARQDNWGTMLDEALDRANATLQNVLSANRMRLRALGVEVRGVSERTYRRWLGALGVIEYRNTQAALDEQINSWARENARLISSVPERYLDDVSTRVQSAVRQGKSVQAFAKELQQQFTLAESRAKLIARTEVAKLNGTLVKAQQQALGIREYIWQTSGDERVRSSHAAMHGKICRWDDDSVYRDVDSDVWRKRSSIGGYIGQPGQDYNCRCGTGAVVSSALLTLLAA